jgi:hypothetical protein
LLCGAKARVPSIAVKTYYDRVYGLTALYAQRDDPWGRNPTVVNIEKYAESVDPVIAGLFRT